MEAHILHLLRGSEGSSENGRPSQAYKNNIQHSRKAYPLNKSVKQGKLHQTQPEGR